MTRVDGSPCGGPVFVAEHEPEVAEMTRRYLERAAIPVRVTGTAAGALAMLGDRAAELFVIDLTMPWLDLRRLRRALVTGAQVPVVFLVDSHAVRPRGLSGAAIGERRWVSRPFGPRTLVTAVTELLRPPRRPTPPPSLVRLTLAPPGTLTLDADRRVVVVAGQAVPLTRTEFALIAALASRPGRVLSRPDLLAALADARGKSPGPRAVDVYVTQLRTKLPRVTIRTVRGVGYVLEVSP